MNGNIIKERIAAITGYSLVKTAARIITALVVVVGCIPASEICAQSCNPAVVSYLVRDEKGKLLGTDELNSVREQLPERIGDAAVSVGDVEFARNGSTFYWPEDSDHPKGEMVPALEFINNGTCTMHLEEVTLIYKNKKMRLLFNLEIARKQNDRRPVVDSLPFQEGTFALDLNGWSHSPEEKIPASRWKKAQAASPITTQRLLWMNYDLALWDRFDMKSADDNRSARDSEINDMNWTALVKRLILHVT